tara:strand:+ start:3582 stop:3686 length:105 start_codon:yes stop_codon:yes gene_type:complete
MQQDRPKEVYVEPSYKKILEKYSEEKNKQNEKSN